MYILEKYFFMFHSTRFDRIIMKWLGCNESNCQQLQVQNFFPNLAVKSVIIKSLWIRWKVYVKDCKF